MCMMLSFGGVRWWLISYVGEGLTDNFLHVKGLAWPGPDHWVDNIL